MKSNEERVNSILNKAKLYKKKRGEMLAGVTLAMSLLVAVLVGVNVGNYQKDNPIVMNPIAQTGETGEEITLEGELVTFASKDELVNRFEANAKQYEKNQYGLRYYTNGIMFDEDMAVAESAVAVKSADSAVNSSASQTEHSTTNTQVQGVDESDMIKTDGKRIYYMNHDRSNVKIFEEVDGKIQLLKTIELSKENETYGNEMFLDDRYLIVIGTGYQKTEVPQEDASTSAKRIAYFPYRTRAFTEIYLYDIHSFDLVRKIETEGNLLSSRKVGDNVYLVTNKYLYYYNFDRDDVIPLYKDTAVAEGYCELPIENIRAFKDFEKEEQCNYMIVTSLNISNLNNQADIQTYLGTGNEIYCSTKNLYVTKANYNYRYGIMVDFVAEVNEAFTGKTEDMTTTSIHKFSLQDGKTKYIATGEVPGTLLNQFSMDEYDGNFRITTTKEDGNNLYVLDSKLNIIGELENLAKGERIYSTRFMGDKAYVVTYKTVDPLFVIDLSTPTKPAVLGELKIPGYSSYLHPLGENYLFGFGEDSVEKSYIDWQGEQQVVAYSTGLKMAIFDVSDYSNPKEVSSVKIGGRGSYSELLYNHKVLLLDEKNGIVAFPASVNKEAGYYQDGTPMYGELDFAGALVYHFDTEEGFELEGKITHEGESKYSKYGNIERIIYIGDKYYTVSNNMIKATDRKTMQEVSQLSF